MKIKTLIIGSFIIAGILTGCNGQSATATIETETTTEIESTTESESTTSEIALENEKGMPSFSSTQGKVEGEKIDLETEPAEEATTEEDTNGLEVDAIGNDGVIPDGEYDEEKLNNNGLSDKELNDIAQRLVDQIAEKNGWTPSSDPLPGNPVEGVTPYDPSTDGNYQFGQGDYSGLEGGELE